PRQLELSLGTGLVWQTKLWPRVRLGILARSFVEGEERNLGAPGGPPNFVVEEVTQDVYGAVFAARFLRSARGNVPGIDLDFYLEYLENSDFNLRRNDVNLRFLFPVYGGLGFAPSFNYYQYTDSRLPGSADYFKYAVALTYRWKSRYQTGTVPGPKAPRQQKKR
ncbi:hypothetical protein, partial [Herbaspirillum sp.]|uniref:hypothetical protein n=1 Tax=Herbaspirillum sp. TaxID=1890675 RepID=UPI00258C9BA5